MKRVKLRKILVGVLVVLTCLSITVTTVDTWAHRTLLNTNEWVDTVAPLGTNPQVTAALANYVTTQIVTTLDLEQRAQTRSSKPRRRRRSSPLRSRTRSRGSCTTRWWRSSTHPPGRRCGPRRTGSRTRQVVNILRGRQGPRPDERERADHVEPPPGDHRGAAADPVRRRRGSWATGSRCPRSPAPSR